MATVKLQTKVKFGIAYKAKMIFYRMAWPVIKLCSSDVDAARAALVSSLLKSVYFNHVIVKSSEA